MISQEQILSHGLTMEEYSKIVNLLNREPNLVELGIFSAMWSEHCSYKSTRVHLKKIHTSGECVICGPGENAGIVDAGDGDAIVFKMESHNHPSFIEPFNGAATGVGGILRDVFTMGARPIANLNSLRFGALSDKNTRRLVEGVVHGISFYGNCVGVPMISGQTTFDPSYNGNILVNAMAIGLAKKDKIFYSAASEEGLSVIYFGSKTGRDGIHGASMSSAEFSEDSESKRPTVQVGDPFYEKLLIEACLELMEKDLVISIQDMGAAGLTCASAEMASKGDKGIEVNLDYVPQRESGMNAYEIMLSESQERMLMTIKPSKEAEVFAILEKWNLSYANIGKITNTRRLVIMKGGKIEADIPIKCLSDEAPIYDRPFTKVLDERNLVKTPSKPESQIGKILLDLLSSPNICDKSFIYEQYDRGVQGKVISTCGQAFGAVKIGAEYNVPRGTNEELNFAYLTKVTESTYTTSKAVLSATVCNPSYVASNAHEGAKQAVCETYRIISAAGGRPLAITNCLNFGNPQKPNIMGQIVDAIEGISQAAKELDYPVVSGNVSLYNETEGVGIKPTPSIAGVGLVKDFTHLVDRSLKNEGDMVFVLGKTSGHLTNTLYAREIEKIDGGVCPRVNLQEEKIYSDFVRNLVGKRVINASASVGNGGILITLAKMCLSGNRGISVQIEGNLNKVAYLFGEDQGRFIISTPKEKSATLINLLIEAGIIYSFLGYVNNSGIDLDKVDFITLDAMKEAYTSGLKF